MKLLRHALMIGIMALTACSVMPKTLQHQAWDLPFEELIHQGQAAVGHTVIVGGYVLKVANHNDHTQIEAVQAPLGFNQKPQSKDDSKGRLILSYSGFLDPEVYQENRKITVGGKILGSSATEISDKPYPYLHLMIESIHLWPVEIPTVYVEPDPLMWDPWDPFFPWYRYPPRRPPG